MLNPLSISCFLMETATLLLLCHVIVLIFSDLRNFMYCPPGPGPENVIHIIIKLLGCIPKKKKNLSFVSMQQKCYKLNGI